MGREVIMPALGMAQDTGKLITWVKQPGEAVAVGDLLFEVETDKSVSEVEAQAAGFLTDVSAAEGEDVPVGQVIAMISETAEESGAPPPAAAPEPKAEPEPEPDTAPEPDPEPEPPAAPQPAAAAPDSGGRILASPKAKRLAAERGLDLARLAAAGHPQPYHVADLEVLTAMPDAAAPAGATRSLITAEVPSEAFDALLMQMKEDAGLELEPHALVAGFAAAALRKARGEDAEETRIVVGLSRGGGGTAFRYADPDRTRPTRPRRAGEDEEVALHLRDLTGSRVTGAALASETVPALTLGGGEGAAFRVGLSFGTDLADEAAFTLIDTFAARLEAPLEHLV